jgi:hypothetical protein
LLSPVEKVAELPQFFGWKGNDGDRDVASETGEDASVDGISFGELSVGFGEVASAFGLDDGDRDAGLFKGQGDRQLQPAGGFEDNADVHGLRGKGLKELKELTMAVGGIGYAEAMVGGKVPHVKVLLRDIDTNEDGGHEISGPEGSCGTTNKPTELVLANAGSRPR